MAIKAIPAAKKEKFERDLVKAKMVSVQLEQVTSGDDAETAAGLFTTCSALLTLVRKAETAAPSGRGRKPAVQAKGKK